jgi:hypothetical protein
VSEAITALIAAGCLLGLVVVLAAIATITAHADPLDQPGAFRDALEQPDRLHHRDDQEDR